MSMRAQRRVRRRGLPLAGALAALAVLLCSACQREPALAWTEESPTEVARAVITGLDRGDVATLRALAVSEAEFRDVIWPKQPASRPERNMPWDYAWKDLRGKSEHQLAGRMNEWAGEGCDVVRVAFAGETTDYGTYRVHRKSVVTLRDREGHERTARLFGSIVEQDGRFKVFSYVAD